MPLQRSSQIYEFLVVEHHHIKISAISSIDIVEEKDRERISIFLPHADTVHLYGEKAIKYMTSLKAFMRVHGEVGLIEYAEKQTGEERKARLDSGYDG